MRTAPWPVVTFVSCLPVLVLGAGAALAHLIHRVLKVYAKCVDGQDEVARRRVEQALGHLGRA